VGTFGMLSRLLRGEHMPIFSFLLIFFSDLLPILTGLRRTIRIPYEGGWICETVRGPSVRPSVRSSVRPSHLRRVCCCGPGWWRISIPYT